jgi:hypothetical protein
MSDKIIVIGTSGFKGSGKDTVGDHFVEKYGFKKLSFAYAVKKVVSVVFGWDFDMLQGLTPEHRAQREVVDEWWTEKLNKGPITPRRILQEIGTDLFRDCFHPMMWILQVHRQIVKQIEKYGRKRFVITDCRFINECEWLKGLDGYGTFLIHIMRGDLPSWFSDIKNGIIDTVDGVHVSETEWIKVKPDVTIHNVGSIKELQDMVDGFVLSRKIELNNA